MKIIAAVFAIGIAILSVSAATTGSPCDGDKCVANNEDLCTNIICGLNAECRVINQNATCECIRGCVGDPFDKCTLIEPSTERSLTEKPSVGELSTEELSTETSSSEKSSTEKLSTGKSTTEKSFTEKPSAEKSITEKPLIKKQSTERSSTKELSTEKSPTENRTEKSSTENPTTKKQFTEISSTQQSLTEKSLTEEPSTESSSTEKPSTEKTLIDPCIELSCGLNAICLERNGNATCECVPGYSGNPNKKCTLKNTEFNLCDDDACGPNSKCTNINGTVNCSCLPGSYGFPPYCRSECGSNSDCPRSLACSRNRCKDPCAGGCGLNAECFVFDHVATCRCINDHIGDPLVKCKRVENKTCIFSSDCDLDEACIDQKCVDPCIGSCALNANCRVEFHTPICSCPNGYSGDPFVECFFNPRIIEIFGGDVHDKNAYCMSGECFCLSGFIGQPPHCHRECESNSECPETKVCIEQRCRDPCDGYCGLNTDCFVRNDQPVCICRKGYTGDPYEMCSANLTQTVVEKNENLLCGNMCGKNAICSISGDEVECHCPNGMRGDPFDACVPIRSENVKPQRKEPSLKIQLSISKKESEKESKLGKVSDILSTEDSDDLRTKVEFTHFIGLLHNLFHLAQHAEK